MIHHKLFFSIPTLIFLLFSFVSITSNERLILPRLSVRANRMICLKNFTSFLSLFPLLCSVSDRMQGPKKEEKKYNLLMSATVADAKVFTSFSCHAFINGVESFYSTQFLMMRVKMLPIV